MARARTRGEVDTAEASPPNDAYVGMLIVSLVAMIIGCILLFMDYNQYPDKKAPNPPAVAAPSRSIESPQAGQPKG